MKCPKCDYLGFETGDRCKNCGYDFSLLAAQDPATQVPDLPLQLPADLTPGTHFWLEQMGRPLGEPEATAVPPAAAVVAPRRGEPSLPLFQRRSPHDDEPLIKLPAAPRPPLSVRRTPDAPRVRSVPKAARQPDPEPVLTFADEELEPVLSVDMSPPPKRWDRAVLREVSGPGRRVAAALIDHALLVAIDLVVIYFTLRMAGLGMDGWRLLPVAPMLAFLGLVKLSYFCAFTLVGGQTVGRMAARIQVIADDDAALDPSRAIRRTLAGTLSLLTLGLGLLPLLIGDDRRALHDRLSRTRVVARPSA